MCHRGPLAHPYVPDAGVPKPLDDRGHFINGIHGHDDSVQVAVRIKNGGEPHGVKVGQKDLCIDRISESADLHHHRAMSAWAILPIGTSYNSRRQHNDQKCFPVHHSPPAKFSGD